MNLFDDICRLINTTDAGYTSTVVLEESYGNAITH